MDATWLVDFWTVVIAIAILMYVILDGYDLGVGILFDTMASEPHRATMMSAIAPYWDGNETWLILIGAGLFAAFPMVYVIIRGPVARIARLWLGGASPNRIS
jgi:cytochrome d ubiquinol oxidase subunit II